MGTRGIDWDRLAKIGLVLGEDHRDSLINALEGRDEESPIGGWSLVENYAEHELEVHVHVTLLICMVGSAEPYRAKVCTVFKWPDNATLDKLYAKLALSPEEVRALRQKVVDAAKGAEKVKRAVLVPVPEFMEHSKRVPFRVLPAIERLQSPEACAESWRLDRPQRSRGPVGPVRRIQNDGESNVPPRALSRDGVGRRGTRLTDAEPPDQLVQSGPEVVDDFSYHHRPLGIRRFAQDYQSNAPWPAWPHPRRIHDVVPKFEPRIIEDGLIGVRLRGQEAPNVSIEYLDVVPRAADLLGAPGETTSFLGGWHDWGEDS